MSSISFNYVFFKALEAWRLVLAAWRLKLLKNFSQLAKYDAGSCSCGVMK